MGRRRLWEARADFSSDSWRDYIIRKKVKLPLALNIPSSRRIGRVEIELRVAVYKGDLSVSRYGLPVSCWTGWAKGTFWNSCWRDKSLTLLPSSRQSAVLLTPLTDLTNVWLGFKLIREDESWRHTFGYLKIYRNCSKFVHSCLHYVSYLTRSFVGSASLHSWSSALFGATYS
jgi:hypothetical protein